MAKLTVMLAEDDLTMVNLLNTLLKMEGFDVISVDADANVVEAIAKHSPDVLLLDVHLANQNGLEILEAIRKSEDTRDARVIMTSGLNMKEDCMKRGANGFLLKPFMPDDLVKLLKG